MTGFKSKRAAALDEDGMYLVHHTDWDKANAARGQANLVNGRYILAQPEQDATMQSLKDLKRAVCDEVGKAAFAQPAAARDNQNTVWKPLKGLGTAPDERSEWKCYLFGNTPQDNQGIIWVPVKGQEPNWFVRWMMKVCFACTWEKNNG